MQLVISHVSGSLKGKVSVFERESVLIGRGEHNDIALDPFLDPTVSSCHAEIRVEDATLMLYDMGSLNGTFLNGQAVRRATLSPGDTIGLGRMGPRLKIALKGALPKANGAASGPPRVSTAEQLRASTSGMTKRESVTGPIDLDDSNGGGRRLWILAIVAVLAAAAALVFFR